MGGSITSAEDTVEISLTVDSRPQTVTVSPRTLLIRALRNQMNVTAPHIGCESGRCGACSVLVNGQTVKSCMMLAVQAEGTEIVTAQGMEEDTIGQRLQSAFKKFHALQCGFCTPGMLASARELLRHNDHPTEDDVRQALRGNLCRCTGYQHIIEAVLDAASVGRKSHEN
ncbi:MAG: (2Fe-2S)-binding protein [Sneathiellales bacterium]|nr:(2Fe-2S)-binding protein [Sneathiellales bacterium]